jgi:hypothetical protein
VIQDFTIAANSVGRFNLLRVLTAMRISPHYYSVGFFVGGIGRLAFYCDFPDLTLNF